jgi:ethanolamine ammonia-lyase large subunit
LGDYKLKREIKTPEKEGTISRQKIKEVVKQNPPARKGTGLAGVTYITSWEGITNSVTIEGVVWRDLKNVPIVVKILKRKINLFSF